MGQIGRFGAMRITEFDPAPKAYATGRNGSPNDPFGRLGVPFVPLFRNRKGERAALCHVSIMTAPKQLVGAEDCMKLVFPLETSRPSLRTFRQWQANRFFPVIKIGHLCFFDPEQVRAALDRRFKILPIEAQ